MSVLFKNPPCIRLARQMNLRSGGSPKEHLSIIDAVLNNDIEGTTQALGNPLTQGLREYNSGYTWFFPPGYCF